MAIDVPASTDPLLTTMEPCQIKRFTSQLTDKHLNGILKQKKQWEKKRREEHQYVWPGFIFVSRGVWAPNNFLFKAVAAAQAVPGVEEKSHKAALCRCMKKNVRSGEA